MNEYRPYHRRVNYYETDQMAVVHHSNYIRYFEEARMDFFRSMGVDFDAVEKQDGIMLPVLELNCKYERSARYGDELDIYVTVEKFTGARLFTRHEVRLTADGSLCASGTVVTGFVNASYLPVSIKRRYPELYRRCLELVRNNEE